MGSRYETGNSIPNPVQILLRLTYMPESALLATVAELRAPFNDLPRSTAAAFSIEKWSTGRDLAAQRTALGLTQTAFLGGLGGAVWRGQV